MVRRRHVVYKKKNISRSVYPPVRVKYVSRWIINWITCFSDYDTTEADLDMFLACLDRQLSILDSTVRHRETFQDIVQAQDNLRLVNLTNWAGLGAVQYVI